MDPPAERAEAQLARRIVERRPGAVAATVDAEPPEEALVLQHGVGRVRRLPQLRDLPQRAPVVHSDVHLLPLVVRHRERTRGGQLGVRRWQQPRGAAAVEAAKRLPGGVDGVGPRGVHDPPWVFPSPRESRLDGEAPERMVGHRRKEEVRNVLLPLAVQRAAPRVTHQQQRLPQTVERARHRATRDHVEIGVDAAEDGHVQQPRGVGALDASRVAIVQRQQRRIVRRPELPVVGVAP